MVVEPALLLSFGRCQDLDISWPAVNQGTPELIGEFDAPVYVVEKRTARTRKEQEPGVYIYDLEQEMAGVPRIVFHEEKTRVTIRYAEVLYPDVEKVREMKEK